MADRIGQQIGIYQLTSLLAENVLAEVYRGEQRYAHIEVAIKLLRRPLATTPETDLFRNEARALAALSNSHIARVLSFDVQNQVGYLVMDYIPGGTLRQRHPGGAALPLETILPYITQIAEALDYTHNQGIVHQALQPENLLLRQQDEIVLAGFYLASAYPPAENEATIDINRITVYLAPEQLQQKPVPASDQYALGVIVYEWLSGTLPFQGSGAELAQHIFKSAPPPLHGGVLVVSQAVERVVMRALAKDPAKRFPTVQAFAAALEEASHVAPPPQPAATSAAAAAHTPKQPAAAGRAPAPQAGRAPAPQAAAYPPAAQARTQQPPQQAWPGQPTSYQTPAQQPVRRQNSSVPTRSARASNAGCIVALVIVAVIGLIFILANAH